MIHLGDLPTWLAALGTVGALAAALWQIGSERTRRLEREAQDRKERHLAQARLIAAVIAKEEPSDSHPDNFILGQTYVDLINGSAEPVYRLVIAIVNIQGTLPRSVEEWIEYRDKANAQPGSVTERFPAIPVTTASILPSGMHRVRIQGIGWNRVLSGRGAVDVAFTDRAGSHWIRRGTGQLEELPEDPITYLIKYGPHELQTPERLT